MSIFDPRTWFKRDAAVELTPQPVDLNPDQSRQYSRALARYQRVKAAIRKGDKRKELQRELVKLDYLVHALKKD